MTDTPEKKKRARRTLAEIAEEKRAWLLKHEWAGHLEALELIELCAQQIVDAWKLCDDPDGQPLPFEPAQKEVDALLDAIRGRIPKELQVLRRRILDGLPRV